MKRVASAVSWLLVIASCTEPALVLDDASMHDAATIDAPTGDAATIDASTDDASTDDAATIDAPTHDAAPDAATPSVVSIRLGDDASFDEFSGVAIAADGTVFAAGMTQRGAGSTDAFVATFDSADQLVAARAFGTTDSDDFLAVASDRAGTGVVIAGVSGSAQQVGIVVALDGSLTIRSSRAFGGSMRPGNVTTQGGQGLNAIARVPAGFVLAGETFPGAESTSGASWVLALDDDLAPRWEIAFDDGVDRTSAQAVAAVGAHALIGSYAHPTAETAAMRITDLDDGVTSSTTTWLRQLDQLVPGDFNHDVVTAIGPAATGELWVVGYTDFGGGFVGQVVKLAADGTVLGELRLEVGNAIFRTVIPTDDGGCIIAGDAANHGLIVKLDASLGVTWHQSVGVGAISLILAGARAPDGSIVLVGRYGADGWLLRLRSVDAAPIDFGTPSGGVAVSESSGSSSSATMHVSSWASTSTAWTPVVTDLSALPVRPAP